MQRCASFFVAPVQSLWGADGNILPGSEQRYLPFGQVRSSQGNITQTDFGYTGQRDLDGTGLMDYKARFYDSSLGRFIQPDTIVSNPINPQTWNRYSCVSNNPVNRTDPTGHRETGACGVNGEECGGNIPQAMAVATLVVVSLVAASKMGLLGISFIKEITNLLRHYQNYRLALTTSMLIATECIWCNSNNIGLFPFSNNHLCYANRLSNINTSTFCSKSLAANGFADR